MGWGGTALFHSRPPSNVYLFNAHVAFFLFRQAPQPHIVCVPVEVSTAQGGGLDCLPLIIVGLIALLALGVVWF